MAQVKLIYFKGCPNAEKSRQALRATGVPFDEVSQDELPPESPFKSYSSPTILNGNNVIFGSQTDAGSGGCSLEVPTAEVLVKKLGMSGLSLSTKKPKGVLVSAIGSFGSALTVGLCPLCIPAIGAFLSALGLGFLVQTSVLLPLLIGFLAINMGGLLWSYVKEHGNILPLVGGILTGAALYIGRYVYLGALINQILMYGGIAGIIAVSFWNLRLRKKVTCPACVSGQKG